MDKLQLSQEEERLVLRADSGLQGQGSVVKATLLLKNAIEIQGEKTNKLNDLMLRLTQGLWVFGFATYQGFTLPFSISEFPTCIANSALRLWRAV